jgi:hypothetical protein
MKRLTTLFVYCTILILLVAGCSSNKNVNTAFNKKNSPLPDYVLNSSKTVQETYVMASNYPDVLAQVPCYCGCGADGHKNNLSCFVKKMGSNNTVDAYDPMGIS